jgi:hypothetical protein
MENSNTPMSTSPKYFKIQYWDYRPNAVLGDGRTLPDGVAAFDLNSAKWFDVIRCDKGGLMISERAASALNELREPHGSLREYAPHTKGLMGDAPPPPVRYFHWLPSDTMRVADEFFAQGISSPIMRWRPFVGADGPAFGWAKGDSSQCMYCTISIVLLARRHKLTNFRFTPLDLPDVEGPPFRIKYVERRWPPQWYPEGFEADSSNLSDTVPADPCA